VHRQREVGRHHDPLREEGFVVADDGPVRGLVAPGGDLPLKLEHLALNGPFFCWASVLTRAYKTALAMELHWYDSMSDDERGRFEKYAGYERREWYKKRARDEAHERYDQALEDMEDEIWRERRRC
jgi:hypothetical protein